MNPFGKTIPISFIKKHSHNLDVPLRKNFGSGYPLYLLGRTPPQEDAAPIPHVQLLTTPFLNQNTNEYHTRISTI